MKIILSLFIAVSFFSSVYAYEEIPEDAKGAEISNSSIDNITDNITDNSTDNKTVIKSRVGTNTILNLSGINAEEIEVILVDKNLKRMYVAVLNGSDMEVIKEYPVLTGRVDGDKLKRGDEKTPEGVYYVLSYSSGDELVKRYGDYALIYGAGSFPLNYPNIIDKIKNKTGGGIWLHGTKPDLDKHYTQGCVALNNTNFLDMKTNVKIGTPVIIAENLIYNDNISYNDFRDNMTAVLDNFTNAWQNSNKTSFKNIIHKDFRTPGGLNSSNYTASKTVLMDKYPEREIKNFNTKIFAKDNGYVLFDTDQFYCAKNLSSYNNKRYYFLNDNGALKLISEEVYKKNIKDLPYIDETISSFLNKWINEWQNKDIEKYMSFYDKNFTDGKDNYNTWKKKKERLFASPSQISVKVSNIKWKIAGGKYIVEFIQDYSSGAYRDRGIKEIHFSGCPSNFKIAKEIWRKI